MATAQISLGMTYIALSNYERAKELLEKALPILEKHYGEEHFEIGIILENLSMVCLVLRDYERAKESLERALPILEPV